jgi:transcriptional regulator with XRE-family HTH domain
MQFEFPRSCLRKAMGKTFDTQLRQARRNCHDPDRGGQLTQERFAELISLRSMRAGFPTPGTVSNWECGRSQPSHHDRETLCAILEVLVEHGGLASQEDANSLLARGGYAALTKDEATSLSEVLRGSSAVDERNRAQAAVENRSEDTAGTDLEAATLIVVRHQSMEPVPQKAVLESLPDAYTKYRIIELVIDQCDLFRANRLSDPREAAYRQADLVNQMTELLVRYPDAKIAYYGIAHIPLHFLAGFQISNRGHIALFDFDRYRRTWDQLQKQGEIPQLIVTGLPSRLRREHGEVVVRVSIAHRVTPEVVSEVIPTPMASIHLTLKQPQADVVTSEQQIQEYGRVFRRAMDEIHARLPQASGIHVFYAGPASLAFYCGQQVSKTIHPRFVVYNYTGQDVPRYSWGLDLTRAIDAPDFLLQPGNSPSTLQSRSVSDW